MELLWPNLVCSRHSSELIWTGPIKPSLSSAEYIVEISYSVDRRPKVRVVSPSLIDPPKLSDVHRYSDGTLCLHLREQWNQTLFVADKIIPWISEWLMFYEGWLVTDEWLGGGEHP
jgi:hypothetical protein